MRRILLIVYLFLLATTTVNAQAALRGAWHARQSNDGSVHLSLVRDHSSHGRNYKLSELNGLSGGQLSATNDTPVKFTMARDAGTLVFDGVFGDGEGSGRFTFTPNAGYASDLRNMGIRSSEDIDDERLYSLAVLDVSRQFIRDMQASGYNVSLEDYVRFRIHGASPEYVRELKSLGYGDLSAEDLVRFRIHGVSTEYVRAMRDLGYTPAADDLVRFRIHGVSPELVKTLRTEGYRDISSDELVRFRIHGVSSDFIRSLHALGYKPTGDELVRMRIHGVSTEFIESLRDAGYSNIPVDKLIQMRIHGIDAKYLKAVNK
jgi:hypothetical protein